MNSEQLMRYLDALEAIAVNTARIADALETGHHEHVRVTVTPTDLNPKGPYA